MGMDDSSDRVRAAGDEHPLIALAEALESDLERDGSEVGSGVSALADQQLQQVATRAWQLIQQLYGALLLPVLAEADRRGLFRRERYAGASSMRDLISGWLRCNPATAGRLLYLAKHCVTGTFRTTGDALAAGDIDTDHARAVVQSVRRLPSGLVDRQQHDLAQTTMLDTARTTDPEITTAAGHRLFELVAPWAAEEHADRQAERDRQRAESSRWFEVTGIGIAGAKEIRLRAESEVIDTLLRVMSGLVQSAPADDDGATIDSTTADGAVDSGDQAPGSVADIDSGPQPIERRRADAAAEIIDAIARPDLLDDLTAAQLRRLANQLEGAPTTQQATMLLSSSRPADAGNDDIDTNVAPAVVAGPVTVDSCAPANPGKTAAGHDPAGPDDVTGNSGPTDRGEPNGISGSGVGLGIPAARSPHDPGADSHPSGSGEGAGTRDPKKTRSGNRPRGERPSLIVIASYDPETGRPRAGEANSTGAPARYVSSREIERTACEALITPVWMTDTATPVTVATPTRYFRGRQLAALVARDRGCCFPGCNRGLRYAHAHHVRPWSEGGPTSVDNGALLCGHHHRLIHNHLDNRTGWKIRIAADGMPEVVPPRWMDPTGQPLRHARHQIIPARAA